MLPVDNGIAGAVEGVALRHHPLLQSGGQHHRLEGGARLIGVVDHLAAPLLEAGVAHRLVIGLVGARRVAPQGLQRGGQALVDDGAGLVQVIGGDADVGQDGPGVRVHDDADAAPLGVVGLDALLHRLLGELLDVHVDGEGDVAAVGGVHVVGPAVGHLGAVVGLGGDHPAHRARQLLVIQGLHPVGPAVVVDEAHHLGGQAGVGVIPLGAGGEVDAGAELVLADVLPHGGGVLPLQVPGQDLIGGVPPHALLHVGPVQLGENGAKAVHDGGLFRGDGRLIEGLVGDAVLILIVLLVHAVDDVPGGEDQVVHRGRHGQHVAVAVQDVPPHGADLHVPGLLPDGQLLVVVVLHDADLPQRPDQGEEHEHPAHRHEEDAALEDHLVGPAVVGALGAVAPLRPVRLPSVPFPHPSSPPGKRA